MSYQIKNQFDQETLIKVGKGALIAGGGALVVYLLTWATTLDFGELTPVVVAIAGIVINAIKEYKKGIN